MSLSAKYWCAALVTCIAHVTPRVEHTTSIMDWIMAMILFAPFTTAILLGFLIVGAFMAIKTTLNKTFYITPRRIRSLEE